MANTTFTDGETPVVAAWANDVNDFVYEGTLPSGASPLPIASGGTNAATAAAARTSLGVAIGTNVEAWSSELDAVAALATTGLVARTGSHTYTPRTLTGQTNYVTVTNGDGVSGAPTITIGANVNTTDTAQSITGVKTFNDGSVKLLGATSGTTTFKAAAIAGTGTITMPTGTDTLAALGTSQTFSGTNQFNDGSLQLKGSTSGTTTLHSAGTAGTSSITFPAATDTAAVLGTAQTWTGVQQFGTVGGAVGKLSLAGSTSGSTLLNAAATAGSGTMTLPTGTDTLAGLGTAQTWTGVQQFGTIGGAVGKLVLAGSTSGSTILNAAATAGSTTLTLQGTSGTVYSSGGGTKVAVTDGGTGIGTYTAYAPVCAGTTATGNFQDSGTLGASGTVFTSNGTSALPTWQVAPGLILISTTNISNVASVAQTTGLTSYNNWLIIFENIIPITDATSLQVTVGNGGGPTYYSSYDGQSFTSDSTTNTGAVVSSATVIKMNGATTTISNSTSTSFGAACGSLWIRNTQVTNSANTVMYDGSLVFCKTGVASQPLAFVGGTVITATALSAVKIAMSSGNLSSGVIKIYGLVG